MAKKTDTARINALAEELIRTLESQRRLGGAAYPPTLRQLAELCEEPPPDDLVVATASKKPFSDRATVEKEDRKPKLDAPVYFKEDKPPKLSKAELAKLALAGLADRILKVLESQRRLGGDAYPLPLRRLVELCELKASDSRVPGLVGHPTLADSLIIAGMSGKKPNLDAPAFLRADLANVLPALALFALDAARTGPDRAFTAKKLIAKLAPDLRPLVEKALAKDQVEHQNLPPEVAWVPGARGEPLFFHVADLRPRARPESSTSPRDSSAEPHASLPASHAFAPTSNGTVHASRPDFSKAFREAFDRLDQSNRSTNFVKLSDLRRALSDFGRDEFDAGLRRLREDAIYSLNSHEGLHGALTAEDREAGVQEVGSLLIYASRR